MMLLLPARITVSAPLRVMRTSPRATCAPSGPARTALAAKATAAPLANSSDRLKSPPINRIVGPVAFLFVLALLRIGQPLLGGRARGPHRGVSLIAGILAEPDVQPPATCPTHLNRAASTRSG